MTTAPTSRLDTIPLSVLDLAPIRDTGSVADTFHNSVSLAQHVEALIVGRDEQQIGSLHDLPFLADRGLLRIAADKQQGEYQQRVSSHGINYHAF